MVLVFVLQAIVVQGEVYLSFISPEDVELIADYLLILYFCTRFVAISSPPSWMGEERDFLSVIEEIKRKKKRLKKSNNFTGRLILWKGIIFLNILK